MSTPESLRILASTQGSIASLYFNFDELPSDPITACSKPMCSLKAKLSLDQELAVCNILFKEISRISQSAHQRFFPKRHGIFWILRCYRPMKSHNSFQTSVLCPTPMVQWNFFFKLEFSARKPDRVTPSRYSPDFVDHRGDHQDCGLSPDGHCEWRSSRYEKWW